MHKKVRIEFSTTQTAQSNAKALNSTNNTPKIIDMPLELLLDIYEDLDVSSLTNIAKTHPYNWDAAGIVYKTKFAIEMFDIHGQQVFEGFLLDGENKKKEFEAMLSSLQTFGHLITKLKLNYNYFTDEQRETVNQYVNDYITNSLVEIELRSFKESDLLRLAVLLKHVEIVHLSEGNVSSHMNLSEIFTAVRTLDLTFAYRVPPSFFEYNFPHLEKIYWEHFIKTDSDTFERRLRLNPQLKYVNMWNCEWEGLRLMSELLPSLENIELLRIKADPPFQGDDIHLEHLKVFSLSDYISFTDLPRTPIIFGNLEEITCYARSSQCLDMFMQNKNMRKIQSIEFDANEMQRMAEELPNLEEFTGHHGINDESTSDKVVNFIETSRSLRRAAFRNSFGNNDAVVARLPNWSYTVEKNPFNYVVFIRNDIGA